MSHLYFCLSESYINYVRVALAVAIIKSKPKDQNLQCYVSQLRTGLDNQQQDWKEKYSLLKQEMFKLKQQNALMQLCTGRHSAM